MNETTQTARRERVSSFAGVGCAIQAFGLAAPVVLYVLFQEPGAIIGIVVMIGLFVKGSSMAVNWRCGHCRNPLASKDVMLCPVCKVKLK